MNAANLGQVFRHQARRLGPSPALRFRRHGLFRDLSWEAYWDASRALACALAAAGVRQGDRVGLLAENGPEWLIADLGILLAGAVTVSPHAPLTAPQVRYQLRDAGAVWCFVSDAGQWRKLQSIRGDLPDLRGVASFAPVEGVENWRAFARRGAGQEGEIERRLEAVGEGDLATVMYTSGTTGNPKGVMLTHGNLLSNSFACLSLKPPQPDELLLSWLPFTHIYARTVDHYGCLCAGTTLALGTADTLVADLADLRPTHMSSVPRFYEKLYSAVAALPEAERRKRLRGFFGDRVDWVSSGGAPLPVPLAEEYHAAGIKLMQGYGLTESSPVISFNYPEAHRLGSVGKALPGVEVRIAEDGEILTRGPHVMKGYWNDEAATAETIKDGWLCTGDLGRLDEDGFLYITGRKKELMVLSNGKKIVPTHLEGLLCADECIDQAVVVGEGRNFLCAIIVPRKDAPADEARLLERCKAALSGLSHMEQIKKVIVRKEPFTVEGDEMTVSLKLRRAVILERHKADVERAYGGEA
ncbi:MAG: AMP-dependent synthetase/ligase [Gemmataceae bacterium]|nr:AMP-dependent synthetase/ligase [Gemmataceae bacterium]